LVGGQSGAFPDRMHFSYLLFFVLVRSLFFDIVNDGNILGDVFFVLFRCVFDFFVRLFLGIFDVLFVVIVFGKQAQLCDGFLSERSSWLFRGR
jgi:hypothetical protein